MFLSQVTLEEALLFFMGDKYEGLLIKSIFQQEALKKGILAAGWHILVFLILIKMLKKH